MKRERLSWPARDLRRRSLSEHTLKLKRQVRGIRRGGGSREMDGGSAGVYRRIVGGQRMWKGYTTLQDLERECQERCESAYQYGFKDGKKIGLQGGRGEIEESVNYLNHVAETLLEKREAILREAEGMIVQLAVSVAKTILHREVQLDPKVVKAVAKESLKLIEGRKRVSIRIHPSDSNELKELEKDILSTTQAIKDLDIIEDDHVNPGGCIIETDSGIVDAQLNTQLDEIAMSLMEVV